MAERIILMNNSSDLQKYQAYVRQKLNEINDYLAYISVGDFTRRFNVFELEDNEFAELFCGLDLMMDDLVETQDELKHTNENLEKLVRQRTKELETEKERLAITLRSIAEGVIAIDTAGTILLMNTAAEAITGWHFEETKNIDFQNVFILQNSKDRHPVLTAKHLNNLSVESLTAEVREAVLTKKDNLPTTISYSTSPAIDRTKSTVIGVVIVFRDIEEKKKTENELFRMKKLESVGILAGGIAHDFNNILTGIITNLQLAIALSPKESETLELLRDADHASRYAVNLTKQLLTFSKGGAPVKENASFTELIKESVKFSLSGSNITAQLTLSEDLWHSEMDKGQINQVLNNIIINAVQAMPDGGIVNVSGRNTSLKTNEHHSILLDNLKQGNYVEIAVTDSGTGIDAENLDKIFDPYFTTKKNGTGLGLTIVYSIIKNHNGHITVSSDKTGSVFTFYLPANPEQKPVPAQKLKTIEKGNGSILIMDDDHLVLKALGKLLQLLGYEVTCAKNGEEVLKEYKERESKDLHYTAVILDLTIKGGMGGKETVQALKKINPDAKVIVTSGYSNDPIIANYHAYGFDDVIPKPFSIEQLSTVVSRVTAS